MIAAESLKELRAGEQLEGYVLYERQKQLRARQIPPAPVIVAVGLSVPENMGAVLRLADAAASARVIFVNDDPPWLAKVRRTARSTDTHVKWQVLKRGEFSERVETLPMLIALELTTTSTNLFRCNLPNECAFVIGNEQRGIPNEILALCEFALHIPMFGVNGSMNVTHALGIALYEWRRQHTDLTKSDDWNPDEHNQTQ